MSQPSLSKETLSEIIQWDVKNWSKCIDFWNQYIDHKTPKKVLALGEREGGMSLYFALCGHEVICSDYNPMPDSTVALHKEYKVTNRITYQKIDMKAIDLPDDSVDVVVFKSVLGALGDAEDQEKALSEIYRVLRKDGQFLFAENLEGTKLHQFLRKKFVNWGSRWRYITRKEMKSWNDQYQSFHTKTYGVTGLFGRSEKQRKILGGADRILTPVTPKNWRYILFGVAKK
jgi:ubiquinone/menaquinone biosynthesis C-methylase UbiE